MATLRLEDVLRVSAASEAGSGKWLGFCPAHDDHSPSLDITRGTRQEVIYTCRSKRCQQGKITAALRAKIEAPGKPIPPSDAAKRKSRTAKQWGWPDSWKNLTKETYDKIVASRAHSYTPKLSTLRMFGFREKQLSTGIHFAFPVYKQWPVGNVAEQTALIKCGSVDVDKHGKRKWFQFAPTPEIPQDLLVCSFYSLSTTENYEDVLIVEGQWDALYLCELGFAAVGLLSASQRSVSEIEKQRLSNAGRVFLIPDNDESNAGHEAMEAIASSVPWSASPSVVELPAGTKDMCEMRAKLGGDDAVRAELQRVIDGKYERARVKIQNPSMADLPHDKLIIGCLDDEVEKEDDWLWEYRVPFAALTVFNGNPDVGKSTVVTDIVARTTTGRDWPDSKNTVGPADVLMLLDEESVAITLKPRMRAAEANMKRVHIIKGVQPANKQFEERMLALDTDIDKVRAVLKDRPEIKLIVFDPLTPYLGKARKNNDQEVRAVLTPLRRLAEDTGLAVISLDHFNKDTKMSALHRNSGTVALTAVPRVVWSFFKDEEKEGHRLMLNAKGNTIPEEHKKGLSYLIVGKQISGRARSVGTVDWLGVATQSAEQQVNPMAKRSTAADWIRDYLANGPQPSEAFYKAAYAAGHAKNTLQRALAEIKAESWQTRTGWIKGLPGTKPTAGNTENEDDTSEGLGLQ